MSQPSPALLPEQEGFHTRSATGISLPRSFRAVLTDFSCFDCFDCLFLSLIGYLTVFDCFDRLLGFLTDFSCFD